MALRFAVTVLAVATLAPSASALSGAATLRRPASPSFAGWLASPSFAGSQPPTSQDDALSKALRRPREQLTAARAKPKQTIFGRVMSCVLPSHADDEPVEELEVNMKASGRLCSSVDPQRPQLKTKQTRPSTDAVLLILAPTPAHTICVAPSLLAPTPRRRVAPHPYDIAEAPARDLQGMRPTRSVEHRC